MPNITAYNIDVDINIDVDEFLDECSDKEINKVIKWLSENDYSIPTAASSLKLTFDEEMFIKNLYKIQINLIRVTPEQIEVINQIAKSL